MGRQRAGFVASVAVAALTLALLAQTSVAGATTGTISMDVAGMVPWAAATEFDDPPCPNPVNPGEVGELSHGTTSTTGAMAQNLLLPQGTRIDAFRISIRDNDGDFDGYAYLLRKRLTSQAGYDLITEGYKVLATVHSNGASMNVRTFGTSQIASRTIDTVDYAYYAEIVNCANTVDPLGVQVVWSR